MAEARSRRFEAEVSEAQIAVHWREEEYYYPPRKFVEAGPRLTPAISIGSARSISRTASRSTRPAHWTSAGTRTRHEQRGRSGSVCWRQAECLYNWRDRMRRPARIRRRSIFVPSWSPTSTSKISYRSCFRQVNEFAAVLRDARLAGWRPGDAAYPMVPSCVPMLACPGSASFIAGVGGFSGTAAATGSPTRQPHPDHEWTATTVAQLTDHKSRPTRRSRQQQEGQEVDRFSSGGATPAITLARPRC